MENLNKKNSDKCIMAPIDYTKLTETEKQKIIEDYYNLKAELQKQNCESKYKSVFDNSQHAIFQLDITGKYISINPAYTKISGYDINDLQNTTVGNIAHPDDLPVLKIALQKMITQEITNYNNDIRIIHKNKNIIWIRVSASIHYNHENEFDYILGNFYDITEQKRIEEELEKTLLFQQNLLKSIPTPVFYKDIEGRYIGVNDAFVEFFGKTEEQIIGKTVFDISPKNLAEIYHQKDLELFRNLGCQIYESEIKDANGQMHQVAFHKASFTDKNGKIVGLVGAILDLTSQKNTENALKDSINKYKQLFDFLPLGVSVADKNGNLIHTNKEAERILSIPKEEHLNRTIDEDSWKIIRTDGTTMPPEEFASVRALQENRLIENVEMGILKPGNKVTWINVCAVPDITGEQVIISYTDITDKIEKEKQINEYANQLKKLSLAVEQSPVTIVITNIEGKIEYVNPAFCKITGYTAQEAKGKNPKILKSANTNPEVYKSLWNTILSGETWVGEFVNKKKNGTEYFEEAIISPVKNQNNEIISFIAIKSDITKRKQQEDLIQIKNKQLMELNITKDKFFSIIAHDLKNPFSSIIGFSDLLKNNFSRYDTEKQLKFIETINSTAKNTYTLLENLLEWARNQQGQIAFKPENINLFSLVNTLLLIVNLQARNKNININQLIPENTIIYADPEMLKTVLQNILTNAVKFTRQGGQIVIETMFTPNNVCIKITDNGIGMSKEIMDKLFKPGESKSGTGTCGERGTGLGLIMCKDFIDKHNGDIQVESEPGKGSVFTIILPHKQ